MSVPVTIVATGSDGAGGAAAVCGFDVQLYIESAMIARNRFFILIIELVFSELLIELVKFYYFKILSSVELLHTTGVIFGANDHFNTINISNSVKSLTKG